MNKHLYTATNGNKTNIQNSKNINIYFNALYKLFKSYYELLMYIKLKYMNWTG